MVLYAQNTPFFCICSCWNGCVDELHLPCHKTSVSPLGKTEWKQFHKIIYFTLFSVRVAQLVELPLLSNEVAGSNPEMRKLVFFGGGFDLQRQGIYLRGHCPLLLQSASNVSLKICVVIESLLTSQWTLWPRKEEKEKDDGCKGSDT